MQVFQASFQASRANVVESYLATYMNLEARDRLASLVNQARGNLSKSAFADLLDVSHTSVASWEKGTYMPDVKSLLRISERLGMTVEEFVWAVEGKPTPKKLDEMVDKIKSLPLKQLAVVERAVSDRLFAIAESAGR